MYLVLVGILCGGGCTCKRNKNEYIKTIDWKHL
jgi:hypothetical protein